MELRGRGESLGTGYRNERGKGGWMDGCSRLEEGEVHLLRNQKGERQGEAEKSSGAKESSCPLVAVRESKYESTDG